MKLLAGLAAILLCLSGSVPALGEAEELITHGRFADVHLYRPAGEPRQVVLYLSGAEGWDAAASKRARLLADRGALVAGVDAPRLQAKLGPRETPIGDFENLSHYVQGYARLDTYRTPLIVAAPSRAALAKALTAKAPADLFGGLVVAQDAKHLASAYDAFDATHKTALQAPPATLADLPLVEAPATGPATSGAAKDTFAVLLSGDGGWAGLDKKVAAELAAQGVSVVGLDSLRYFWSPRTPEGLARDLDRITRYYAAHWDRGRVVLIGYSQGANALPAAFNRMPAASRHRVSQVVLIGMERRVAWQFKVSNWITSPADGQPILPEARKLRAATTLCLYGAGDANTLCPELPAASVTAQLLPGGHHFNGAYDKLAQRILARLD